MTTVTKTEGGLRRWDGDQKGLLGAGSGLWAGEQRRERARKNTHCLAWKKENNGELNKDGGTGETGMDIEITIKD